jgi:post-segregation antitoxin (ccd killing protein)
MTRLNVYLPDELAKRARAAKLNISALTQSAVEAELSRGAGLEWLSRVAELPAARVDHDAAVAAVAAAREELAGDEYA